jgi:hypothetical protein
MTLPTLLPEVLEAKVIEWGDSAYGEERYICTQILCEQIFPGAPPMAAH